MAEKLAAVGLPVPLPERAEGQTAREHLEAVTDFVRREGRAQGGSSDRAVRLGRTRFYLDALDSQWRHRW